MTGCTFLNHLSDFRDMGKKDRRELKKLFLSYAAKHADI
ncbi:hypothetical protein lbkm_0990 [Lachnospiraceae bacterium KM106-2]|nr:hypothetical protein lbkm_0990 [Lachnospiraceae bacterium KM106-2]